MVLLLLLLLLPESLANQVCFYISNGSIDMNLAVQHLEPIGDGKVGCVNCTLKGLPCVINCISKSRPSQSFCGSACHKIELIESDPPEIVVVTIPSVSNCSIHLCTEDAILPLIQTLNSTGQKGLVQLFYIRDSCSQLFSNSLKVKRAFIIIERSLIHHIMRTSQLESGGSRYYNLKELALNVVNISEADLTSDGRIQIDAPQLLPQNKSSVPEVWLPVDALRSILEVERIVGLVSYMWHDQFQFEQEDFSSMVIRIELLGEERFVNLTTSVNMFFNVTTHTKTAHDSRLQCHYFDEHEWHWKTDGCETNRSTYDDHTEIQCSCNHTTPFAVLLIREPIAAVHWTILSYISYIGSGLSAFFTACSIVIYVFNWKHGVDYSYSIHVSLSLALFLLNCSFLLTEWGATVKPDWVCVFIAAVMHYSLLSCFTWMAIEALHLYLLLIRVFNTHYKHYLVKLSLTGWGIPGIIVGVSVGVNDVRQLYGFSELNLADTNQTNAICWITDDSFFYGVNLVYFTLIFIFNSGILMVVAFNICKLNGWSRRNPSVGAGSGQKTARAPARLTLACRNGLTVVGLTCLLGITWGLVFLGSGHVNYSILYLFCILNSTQGFFIFLWILGSARKQRTRAMEAKIISNPMMISEIKN